MEQRIGASANSEGEESDTIMVSDKPHPKTSTKKPGGDMARVAVGVTLFLAVCVFAAAWCVQKFPKSGFPAEFKSCTNSSLASNAEQRQQQQNPATSSPASKSTFPDVATLPVCEPLTEKAKSELKNEVRDYEKSNKFKNKIREAKGEVPMSTTHRAVLKYLQEKVLLPGWSVLELGCAAAVMLRHVELFLTTGNGSQPLFVGVELVGGWVKWAQEYYPASGSRISMHNSDITEFALPPPIATATFDFVMLNDVMEHVQRERYGCLFQQLDKMTHPGSIVYMHTPSPMLQLRESGQYYERVVPHHFVVASMAAVGFELVAFEYDVDVVCNNAKQKRLLTKWLAHSKCTVEGWPHYTHSVYRKVVQPKVMRLN